MIEWVWFLLIVVSGLGIGVLVNRNKTHWIAKTTDLVFTLLFMLFLVFEVVLVVLGYPLSFSGKAILVLALPTNLVAIWCSGIWRNE